MKVAIVIPARYQSSRLPGKPLKLIAGISMLERVWRIAKEVKNVSAVIIATDDDRILEAANNFGAQAVMTPANCKNGTERVYAAVLALTEKYSAVVNLQGDTPLTPPWVIQAVVDSLIEQNTDITVTPAAQISTEMYEELRLNAGQLGSTGTYVVTDNRGYALYFSKSLIPALRQKPEGVLSPAFKHIGIYGYSLETLKDYLSLPESNLEKIEGLEQLRLLENQRPIKVVPVDFQGRSTWSVDNPEDIKIVEDIIKKQGELF